MAHGETLRLNGLDWTRKWPEPEPQKARDRSLRGKARRKAAKAARRKTH